MKTDEYALFDTNFLRATLDIQDKSVLVEIYREYVDRLGDFLALAESPAPDAESLYREAHSMKSASGAIGAQRISVELSLLEALLKDHRHTAESREAVARLRQLAKLTMQEVQTYLGTLDG